MINLHVRDLEKKGVFWAKCSQKLEGRGILGAAGYPFFLKMSRSLSSYDSLTPCAESEKHGPTPRFMYQTVDMNMCRNGPESQIKNL